MPMDSIPMTASRLSALILSMHIYYHMHSDSHVPLGSHTHMPANMCIQRSGGHGKFLERERDKCRSHRQAAPRAWQQLLSVDKEMMKDSVI